MNAAVVVHGASKWYGAVIGDNEVSLEIEPGLTGLLGPNGAGKTTLMKLITGQLRPSIGEVRVHGQPVWRRALARKRLGYSPDGDRFHEELTGFQFVYSMARLCGLERRDARQRTERTLARVGMADRSWKRLRECSKGMRQRIKLAQALVHAPDVLVLDEPLSGVDPPGRLELMDLFRELKEESRTVLISSHILEEVEAVTDRVILMAHGRVIASGTVARIRDLMDDYPLTVRIVTDRARELAAELIAHERVVSVRVDEGNGVEPGRVVLRVRGAEHFFRELPSLVTSRGLDVRSVEPLDASAAAIFDYLVGGRREVDS